MIRIGVAHHLGWAVVVAATGAHEVVERRRIELVESGLPAAPVHHDGGAHELHRSGPRLNDDELADLVARVRTSAVRCAEVALEEVQRAVAAPIASISLRDWPGDFPRDIATQRRPPHESRADSIMYREVLAEAAAARGWTIARFDARHVERRARELLGARADEVLDGPRARLGPPWNADHRIALAATVVLALTGPPSS